MAVSANRSRLESCREIVNVCEESVNDYLILGRFKWSSSNGSASTKLFSAVFPVLLSDWEKKQPSLSRTGKEKSIPKEHLVGHNEIDELSIDLTLRVAHWFRFDRCHWSIVCSDTSWWGCVTIVEYLCCWYRQMYFMRLQTRKMAVPHLPPVERRLHRLFYFPENDQICCYVDWVTEESDGLDK